MSISSDIYDGLTGYAALTDLIDDRVYPEILPQGATMPALVVEGLGGPMDQGFDQAVAATTGRYQFTCWAELPETDASGGAPVVGANNIRRILRDALVALSGSSVTLGGLVLDEGPSGFDEDVSRYYAIIDAQILYQD